MKAMIGLRGMFWLLLLAAGFVVAQANAQEVATRCGAYSCSTIVCNRTGNRCRRHNEDRDDWSDRRSERHEEFGYWRYREGRWRRNCDADNPTCVIRGNRFDHYYEE